MERGPLFERIAVALIFGAILVAILRQCWMAPTPPPASPKAGGAASAPAATWKGGDPDDPETVYRYILHVINHGSHQLGFPGGEMEGGYVSPDEAPKIACYVMELGGHRCPHPYPKDAAMYFTSVCGGCHGNDGKGLHGSYPDLTRPRLLGIEKMMGGVGR